MKRLKEFAIVMLILGTNMMLIPNMFEKPGKLHIDNSSEGYIIGAIMFSLGAIILIWQLILQFKKPEGDKKDEKHNDRSSR